VKVNIIIQNGRCLRVDRTLHALAA